MVFKLTRERRSRHCTNGPADHIDFLWRAISTGSGAVRAPASPPSLPLFLSASTFPRWFSSPVTGSSWKAVGLKICFLRELSRMNEVITRAERKSWSFCGKQNELILNWAGSVTTSSWYCFPLVGVGDVPRSLWSPCILTEPYKSAAWHVLDDSTHLAAQ